MDEEIELPFGFPRANTSFVGRRFLYFDRITSTQDIVIALAQRGEKEGIVVLAKEQTRGRGRRGRKWIAPPGSSLLMSVLLRPSFKPKYLPSLSLFSALACAFALEKRGFHCGVKWPNDLMLEDKKVGGILLETDVRGDKIQWVALGIGINVNLDVNELPPYLQDKATSLSHFARQHVFLSSLLPTILEELERIYLLCHKREGRALLRREWEARDMLKGREVEVVTEGGILRGRAKGIDRYGALVLLLPDGGKTTILQGEVIFLKEG